MVNSAAGGKPAKPDYWIRGGREVRLKGGYGPIMTVMRVIEVRRRLPGGTYKTYIEGVLCTYIDEWDGQKVKKRFHTRALEPYGQ